MTKHDYTYAKHRFRFAAWAAAQAIQQPTRDGFGFKNKEATPLFEAIGFDKIAGKDDWLLEIDDFDAHHTIWRDGVYKRLENKKGMSHGRAAKLINIFVKALMPSDMDTISDELQERWCEVHLPIDRGMLKEMDNCGFGNGNVHWVEQYEPWTQLTSCEYQCLINDMKVYEPCLWRVERFWKL